MKRIYVNEEWCLGCHLCEYNCAFANSGMSDMVKALKDKAIFPRIHIEGGGDITYAVSCRHCENPLCVVSCISGALSISEYGSVTIDKSRCVSCFTCILVCPYGAISRDERGAANKCELCDSRACVKGCPNGAIAYEER